LVVSEFVPRTGQTSQKSGTLFSNKHLGMDVDHRHTGWIDPRPDGDKSAMNTSRIHLNCNLAANKEWFGKQQRFGF
jgi:hypothetical protein